jgi:hypothetical protein
LKKIEEEFKFCKF